MFIPLLYALIYIIILLINFFSIFIFKYYNDYYLYLDKSCNDISSIEMYKYRYNIGKINLNNYKNIYMSSFWIFILLIGIISLSILLSNDIYLILSYTIFIFIYILIYYKSLNIYDLDIYYANKYKNFYKNLNGIIKYIINKESKSNSKINKINNIRNFNADTRTNSLIVKYYIYTDTNPQISQTISLISNVNYKINITLTNSQSAKNDLFILAYINRIFSLTKDGNSGYYITSLDNIKKEFIIREKYSNFNENPTISNKYTIDSKEYKYENNITNNLNNILNKNIKDTFLFIITINGDKNKRFFIIYENNTYYIICNNYFNNYYIKKDNNNIYVYKINDSDTISIDYIRYSDKIYKSVLYYKYDDDKVFYIIKYYNKNNYEINNFNISENYIANISKSQDISRYSSLDIVNKSNDGGIQYDNTIDTKTFKDMLRNLIIKYENIGNKADIEYFLENIYKNNDFLKYFILNNNYIENLDDISDEFYIFYKYYLNIDNLYIPIELIDYNTINTHNYIKSSNLKEFLICDIKQKININVLKDIIENENEYTITNDEHKTVYYIIKKYYNMVVNDDNGIDNLKCLEDKDIIFGNSKFLYKNIKKNIDNNLYYLYILIITYVYFLILVLHILLILFNINYTYIIVCFVLSLLIIIKLYEIINR